ncbi:Uncharacterised protein (plasmid) [Legionella adelaidensis]|uniref:Uncharacterized protein n=1 Tax=Legionella adelaidensis TaxID=45056 RepID=A0A0W0R5P2_9GAMM|nr:hypothetical protein [Legionella adelaidensis]KTC66390.1 hypothetical protein Lade_1048 [Legionella adelaidensis]VEH84988.1 Uncharacterised protein [Legionella adelaidensis]
MKSFAGAGMLVTILIIFFTILATSAQSNDEELSVWSAAVNPGPLSAAHSFLSDKCESCHAPKRGIVAEKCITCHASSPELLMNPLDSFHAHLNDCRGCHTEHQGNNKRPIYMDHGQLLKISLQYVLKTETPAKINSPHPTRLDCHCCHSFQDKHQEFFGKDCAICHSEKNWKIPGYLHPSPRSTNCAECHKAPPSHRMEHFGMVDQSVPGEKDARIDQCYRCHQTDSFNDIKRVGWFKMH